MRILKLKISFNNLITLFFVLGLFFLPFNSYEGIAAFGEYKKDSAAIFFLLGSTLIFLRALMIGKIIVPFKNPIYQAFLLFFVWCVISTFINIQEISTSTLKSISGIERFFRQIISITIAGIVFLIFYYNVFILYDTKTLFIKIRRIVFYTFSVVIVYSFFEILIAKFKVTRLEPIFYLFDYFPFTQPFIDLNNSRISSVSFEPPALATYLIFISTWMFSYILTHKGFKKYLPTIFVLLLAFLTGSRSALFFVLFQYLVIFILVLIKTKYKNQVLKLLKYSFLVLLLLFLFKGKTIATYVYEKGTSFSVDEGIHRVSNKSRLGIQYTSLLVFLESPIYGVGFGQQAYRARHLYPKWATENNWEFRLKYLNEKHPKIPPGYNLYTRILAETGGVGFFIFSFFIFIAIATAFLIYKKDNIDNELKLVVLVALIGYTLNGLKIDSFRPFGLWIHLALLLKLTQHIKLRIFSHNEIK